MLKKGQTLDTEALRLQCAEAGYHHVSQVISHGEFSVRGGLVDLFPMGSALPYRLDLFGDEIETIRTFDVDTQRSLYPVPEIRLLPAREFPLDEAGIALFRGQFRETFEGDPQRAKIYKDVSKGVASGGIEWYLPLFFEQTATFLDYLPSNCLLCLHGDLDHSAQQFWREAQSRYKTLAHDTERPLLTPEKLLIKTEDFFSATHPFTRLSLSINSKSNGLPALDIERRAEQPLHKLQGFIADFSGRILIAAESLGRRETISQLFAEHSLQPTLIETWADFVNTKDKVMLGVAPLHHGFANASKRDNIAIITEAELYAATVRQQRRREKEKARSTEGMLKDGILIINTAQSPKEIMGACSIAMNNIKVYTVDASKISKETIGREIPNTPMMGALAKVSGILDFKEMLADTKGKLEKKFKSKPEVIEGNLKAIERAYNEVKS